MELKLNVYKEGNKKEVEKVHRTSSYELMLGTTEDIMNIIDADKIDDKAALAKMIVGAYKQLKPLLFDIFPELTEDELRRVKVKELIPLFADIVTCILEDFDILKQGN